MKDRCGTSSDAAFLSAHAGIDEGPCGLLTLRCRKRRDILCF